ncbi:hypothetical protein [Allosphingosinicella humi]|jgi:hypothetical protein
MSETTEQQGRAPGLYDEQLQRQLQEKRVSREEEREALARDMPLLAGVLGKRQEQEERREHELAGQNRAGE